MGFKSEIYLILLVNKLIMEYYWFIQSLEGIFRLFDFAINKEIVNESTQRDGNDAFSLFLVLVDLFLADF